MFRVYDSHDIPVKNGLFHEYRDAFVFKWSQGNPDWSIKQITFKQY